MGVLKVQYLPQYTIEDYLSWDGDWELIHGIPYAMSPSPGIGHQRSGRKALNALEEALKLASCNCEVFYELDWHVKKDTVVRPDLIVLCNAEFKKDFVDQTPPLVIEVLSPSTQEKDRTLKAELYAAAGVVNYVLIDHEKKGLEVFLLINGRYQHNSSQEIDLNGCKIVPNWSHIFVD
jgi:Uma2 family endonuclease